MTIKDNQKKKYFKIIELLRNAKMKNKWNKNDLFRDIIKCSLYWLIISFNIQLYLYIWWQIVGAIWYVFAIERLSSCWERAYIEHTGCSYGDFDCHKPDDFTFLNEYCPTKTYNSTLVDYGIFRDVIQSGLLEMTDTQNKAHYCLRWGLQSIRFVHMQ